GHHHAASWLRLVERIGDEAVIAEGHPPLGLTLRTENLAADQAQLLALGRRLQIGLPHLENELLPAAVGGLQGDDVPPVLATHALLDRIDRRCLSEEKARDLLPAETDAEQPLDVRG